MMRKFTHLSILLIIVIATISCFPEKKLVAKKPVIAPLSDTSGLREGSLVYALPMTIFTIKVEVEKTIDLPGPYAKYADDLLGLKGVIMNKSEHWSIKGISVSSHQEADPSEFYIIETNGSLYSNVLVLKQEGLILDLNPELNIPGESYLKSREINLNRFRSWDLGSDEYYQVQTDTAFRRVRVDSSFIRIPYIVEKKKKLTDDQLAEKAAKRLMELRDGKILILTGEANVFPQDAAAINEINRMEKEYTELFTGKSITGSGSFSYQFIPQKDLAGKPFTLFRFSEVSGPLAVSASTGTPVIIKLVPEQKTKDLTIITRVQPDPAAPKSDKFFYRIPDIANLKLMMGDEILYNSRKMVYQLGEVMQLPANYVIGK
jgi:hypothetical protein